VAHETRYVKCRVLPGLFGTEFYVVVHDSSAYVNRTDVRVPREPQADAEEEGEVQAYLVSEEDDQVLVELRGEPVVGGLRTWVPRSEVRT
jgi:hypothetical protein